MKEFVLRAKYKYVLKTIVISFTNR